MRRAACLPCFLVLVLAACGGMEPTGPTTAPPVIVVQPPPDTAAGSAVTATAGGASDYAGRAWESTSGAANGEPVEIITVLREFEAELTDPAGDAKGGKGHDDLLSAVVVLDARYLYARVLTQQPMNIATDAVRELRFWLEQGGKMVTVEVKVGSQGAPCELIDANSDGDDAAAVPDCYWLGNAVDIRIPLDAVPATINVAQPFWASGFQTCCSDEARSAPYDTLENAQEVWRVPGLASEQEAVDDKPFTPGKATEDEAPNVP